MSTNGAIGVVINGEIKGIYVHWDSYVEGVGKTLHNHYDQAKAELLIAEGDISSLAMDIGVKHSFNADRGADGAKYADMTTFYRRDRGDSGCEAYSFDTKEDFVEYFSASGNYYYLLEDGVWSYLKDGMGDWKRVDLQLEDFAEELAK